MSFNPSVGILGGQTYRHFCEDIPLIDVSIPQSGFLVVKPVQIGRHRVMKPRFNPSVGILGGQTRLGGYQARRISMFQSLSRDSWWSNLTTLPEKEALMPSFNPSVGILGGQTSKSPRRTGK